jgi:hypothetical protein
MLEVGRRVQSTVIEAGGLRAAGASAVNRNLRLRGAAIGCASKGKESTIDIGKQCHNYKMSLFVNRAVDTSITLAGRAADPHRLHPL